jgi:glycosyltransferase involved in cell wall biosynthesis
VKVLVTFKNPIADNPSACHQGLGITSTNTVMGLREMRIEADVKPIPNGEYLWSKLAVEWTDYTHVILEAPFIDAPFLGRMFARFPNVKFALVYHSNLGFLSQDRFAVASLKPYIELEQLGNFTLASNSVDMSDAMASATGKPFQYLPNLFHLPARVRRTRTPWKPGMTLNIGLFGAARVLKNWLTAAVSTMIISRTLDADIRLHVSSRRDEGAAATRDNLNDLISMNPRVGVVDVPWMNNDDFRRYLYGIDLMLQPSFSETFNNVTAEGCACGVPSVVSDAINWAPKHWKAKSDSAVSVAMIGSSLARDNNAATDGWEALDNHNRLAEGVWQEWLKK